MPSKAYDLTGRTAFVTGAASGIGRASAVLLARAGAAVHCADRDAPGLDETTDLIKETGGTACPHLLDVADRTQVDQAVAEAATAAPTGRVDTLAAIAGIMHSGPVLETREEDLDRVLDVNFKGVLYACQAAARVMIEAGSGGSIITMASGAVDTGAPDLLCYGASKAAVVQLTKTLATEVGPHGIRVNAVAPGWIRTPMTDRHDAADRNRDQDRDRDRIEDLMARRSPLGRVGTPEDVAHAVLYLASDAAAFTTGQILRPNGGVAMPW
ncbi:SDR family NAD(P)-dependent oxidoreductase [Streptomyces spectabilis]|uniref:NAD(P)-dependent dehydrogenase (Short-subunit alcohol dehydrogenase family) n=1 Tax=Streptomyces spectabilis TaxID=68270 RepID=A0A5P2XDL2_STRST|nr:SDR family NAD(P)-dependent oxidoreductase [Streptomyces spectabilis]MBB5104802.1 NAD(P)-dependent dehydrogenase (short-subunit alcohol dehydrogenase family) [Streptomyces spectabilis]MCI3905539.1 SDR family oxidoreductase [Streptomyces spectabilis]QEV62518.1 SDR family oxidoreductase [Streptomyces spectabilis]GGV08165.1 beta-ketoacyl-ACP reductase [Streptomyces spectabilis]